MYIIFVNFVENWYCVIVQENESRYIFYLYYYLKIMDLFFLCFNIGLFEENCIKNIVLNLII